MLKTIAIIAGTMTTASASDSLLRGNPMNDLKSHGSEEGNPCDAICDIYDGDGKSLCNYEAEKDVPACKPCADCHMDEMESHGSFVGMESHGSFEGMESHGSFEGMESHGSFSNEESNEAR